MYNKIKRTLVSTTKLRWCLHNNIKEISYNKIKEILDNRLGCIVQVLTVMHNVKSHWFVVDLVNPLVCLGHTDVWFSLWYHIWNIWFQRCIRFHNLYNVYLGSPLLYYNPPQIFFYSDGIVHPVSKHSKC